MRVRIEIGERVVQVEAKTREEALKAFKFAVRGQFQTATSSRTALNFSVLTKDVDGIVTSQKISAIRQLRNETNLGLAEVKQVIEAGYYEAQTVEAAERIRASLAPYVTFAVNS